MNISEIINHTLKDIGAKDRRSIFMAQGIQDPTAVFGTLAGLGDVVSEERLIEMPVAESAAVGIAVGAATEGMRPILSFHRVEFLLLALEQIFNNAAKANFISGGVYSAPLLIRAVIGRGWGQGPSHSQGFETLFSSVPGLKVICPSVPETVQDMIWSSYLDDAPVICLEHRWVHYSLGELNKLQNKNPAIKPIKLSKGNALTIVSYGYMSLESMLVVKEFQRIRINIELIDLQCIRPLDIEKVVDSVKKTGCLLVVDQGYKFLGIGAEVVSQVTEYCFSALKCAPLRIGLPSLPSPSAVSLAKDYYCTSTDIGNAVLQIIGKEIPNHEAEDVISGIKNIRNQTPFDVPNKYFNGPF